MTAREELQYCYELAFFPPMLNHLWQQIKRKECGFVEVKPLLDKALMLHLALPETGYASQRALQRLAIYQAKSRAFGMVTFLKNIRAVVGCKDIECDTVPGNLVRDIGLPEFSRRTKIAFDRT
ncbi:MAG: hypothetical protein PF904_05980 [Kiritimatiellae bacterium]|jgi:hypothetical protein|nr:hypothetical protein [Kiritimatiellia bacterium]